MEWKLNMKFDQLVKQHLVTEDEQNMDLKDILELAYGMDEAELNKELLNRLHLRQLPQDTYLEYLAITQGDIVDALEGVEADDALGAKQKELGITPGPQRQNF